MLAYLPRGLVNAVFPTHLSNVATTAEIVFA